MNTGDIVLARFPFTDLSDTKVHPAAVVCETPDIHKDLIVCMITSIVPSQPDHLQIRLLPNIQNGLRTTTYIRVYRIATIDVSSMIAVLGKLNEEERKSFISTFQAIVSP